MLVKIDGIDSDALHSGAGADITSIGMRTCLYYICSRPDVYKELQKVIDEFYDTMELTEPITYQQTQQMPYLVAVCKEAMRLLPSIVYQLLRYAPEGLSVMANTSPQASQSVSAQWPKIETRQSLVLMRTTSGSKGGLRTRRVLGEWILSI